MIATLSYMVYHYFLFLCIFLFLESIVLLKMFAQFSKHIMCLSPICSLIFESLFMSSSHIHYQFRIFDEIFSRNFLFQLDWLIPRSNGFYTDLSSHRNTRNSVLSLNLDLQFPGSHYFHIYVFPHDFAGSEAREFPNYICGQLAHRKTSFCLFYVYTQQFSFLQDKWESIFPSEFLRFFSIDFQLPVLLLRNLLFFYEASFLFQNVHGISSLFCFLKFHNGIDR